MINIIANIIKGANLLNNFFMRTPTTFTGSIQLDKYLRDYGTYTVSSNLTVTYDPTGADDGNSAEIIFTGDGSHSINLSAFTQYDTSSSALVFDNTLNNKTVFTRILGTEYWLIIEQTAITTPVQLSAPTLSISSGGSTSLTGTITPVTNNQGYDIYISDTQTGTYTLDQHVTTNGTTFSKTGLSVGTTKWFKGITKGNGTTTLDSVLGTAYSGTTSSLTQLSAPTAGAFSNITKTAFRVAVSGVDANASGLDIFVAGVKYGSTLARTVTYVDVSGLTANTSYSVYFVAKGDGITYSDSANSNTVSQTTLNVAPTLVSSATSTDGLTITHTFSRAMAANPTTTGYSTSPAKTISSATRNTDTTKIDVVVSVAFVSGDTITATIPQWLPADGGDAFAGISGTSVMNNVVSSFSPSDLGSNLLRWYKDARNSSNLVLHNTDKIYQWLDAKNNLPLTAINDAGARPTQDNTNGAMGGGTSCMRDAANAIAQPIWIFIKCKIKETTTTNRLFDNAGAFFYLGTDINFQFITNPTPALYLNGGTYYNSMNVYSCKISGSASPYVIRVNGTQKDSQSSVGSLPSMLLTFFAKSDNTKNINADIIEIIITSTSISAGEITSIETYLTNL